MSLNRRQMLLATGAVTLALPAKFARAQSPSPILTVGSRTLDVDGRAAKVYGISGKGRQGLLATEGDRFSGDVLNETGDPVVMHWHGQVYAPAEQDRARKDGGTLAHGARDRHDFPYNARNTLDAFAPAHRAAAAGRTDDHTRKSGRRSAGCRDHAA